MQTHLHTVLFSSRERPLPVHILLDLFGILSNHSPDAHGDVLRGLQVVETAIAVTSNIVGEKLEGMCTALLYDRSVVFTSP
jgi:hypothetical protein